MKEEEARFSKFMKINKSKIFFLPRAQHLRSRNSKLSFETKLYSIVSLKIETTGP